MPQLDSLLKSLKTPSDVRMRTPGYLLWLSWQVEFKPVISRFMEDYGGLKLGAEADQMLFFFFSTDAFLVAARIAGWARFDATSLNIVVMPATLTMGESRSFAIDLPQELEAQQLDAPKGLCVYLHPEIAGIAAAIPGIKTEVVPTPMGLASAIWQKMTVDPRLPYQANIGWYAVLRPLGSPLDKEFQNGWRHLFEEVEKILQRNKFRYTIHDFFLMFPLEAVHQLKGWTRDLLELIRTLKESPSGNYWPCAAAIVNKKGLTFNNDLPHKIGLDWNKLSADYPCMSFQNALVLGSEFSVHEVRFATGNGKDDWCNVSLSQSEGKSTFSVPLLIPSRMVLGAHPVCFYCGQQSHEVSQCPTRSMPERDKDVWRRVAGFDFASMKEGIRELDEQIQLQGLESLPGLLEPDTIPAIMGRAFFDINAFAQIRNVSRIWRTKGKAPPVPGEDVLDKEYSPLWELWENYPTAPDKNAVDKELQEMSMRSPRDYRLKCFQGFIALERGDIEKAKHLWSEAGQTAPVGFLQAWLIFLRARAEECCGKLPLASGLYIQSQRACPQWTLPAYRHIVCQVKAGFVESAVSQLEKLLGQDANYFNIAILDPEMERGQTMILVGMGAVWVKTELQMQEETANLERVRSEVASWFTKDHPFVAEADARIKKLMDVAQYHNYVPYMAALHGRMLLERDMAQRVKTETRDFKNQFKQYTEKLKVIQDEAAWFPFPKIMTEFNKSFNKCAAAVNWASRSNIGVADSFKKAQILAAEMASIIENLEKRLKLLRLIRDGTLFILTMTRTFFWIEIVGLLLVLVALPLLLFYAEEYGAGWTVTALAGQQWQVQKAAAFIISFLALGVSLLSAVLRFEKIRDALLEKARQGELKKPKKK